MTTKSIDTLFLCNLYPMIAEQHGLVCPIETKILHRIGLYNELQTQCRVKDILGWTDIASYATLHARLQTLIEKRFVRAHNINDRRSIYIALEDPAIAFYEEAGVLIHGAANGLYGQEAGERLLRTLNLI